MHSLHDKIVARAAGICVYGLAPPKRTSTPAELAAIAEHQVARLAPLRLDGLIVYDLQDEAGRALQPRPFPFLPTVEPERWADDHLAGLALPKIVYRSVNGSAQEAFGRWLDEANGARTPRLSVLVGAPATAAQAGLKLSDAYALARTRAPSLCLGGIAIAERHARRGDEHDRMLAKTREGCQFFVTQAVYDVTATKSLLSDYALALAARGAPALPVILTFSPCGSQRTLEFMKWLGIAFPRWLENELRHEPDPLALSLDVATAIFAEVWEYAAQKRIPLGVNVESVSIRKAEIEASLELVRRLQQRMGAVSAA